MTDKTEESPAEKARVSLRAIARATGFGPSYICDMELGRRSCNARLQKF